MNVALRGAALVARFLFIFFLAKFLDPASVGYYGIFVATVGYAMYFVGLDFYTYVSREIVKISPDQRGQMLKGQVALSSILYLILLPLIIWFLSKSAWPEKLIWWFAPILILEHFNQEVSRLLIALSEQLMSSIILFVRQAILAIIVVALMYFKESARGIDVVMMIWFASGVAAACIGVWKLHQMKTAGWGLKIDWKWIKNGIITSLTFLLATLALRGVQTFDRYWLEALGGIELVGAYVLMIGIAGTLLAFLEAAVFAFSYPALIRLHHQKKGVEARRQVKIMFHQTLIISLVFGLVSWLVLPFLLDWIGNPIYMKAASWYPWLLLAMIFNAIGMVPHYALYARGADRSIVYSHILALMVFIIVTYVLSGYWGVVAIFFGLNAAFIIILMWKLFAYFSVIRGEMRSNVVVN